MVGSLDTNGALEQLCADIDVILSLVVLAGDDMAASASKNGLNALSAAEKLLRIADTDAQALLSARQGTTPEGR